MAIANYADYVDLIMNPVEVYHNIKDSLATTAGRLHSLWRSNPMQGAIPVASAICNSDTVGAIPIRANSIHRIGQITYSLANPGIITICDRLAHNGGLSGTVTTLQQTNLPTPALTRYINGVGVMIGLEIYTAIGTTATTVTVNYVDDRDQSLTTPATVFGGTGFNGAGRIIEIPLAQGSNGVKSVTGVTVLATTGTAGNFGVTLYRPQVDLVVPSLGSRQILFDGALGGGGNMPRSELGACLFYLVRSNAAASGVLAATITVVGNQ